MMGYDHCTTGVIAGLVTVQELPHHDPVQVAAWLCLWGGLALAPDADVAGSNASRMWGGLSQRVADGVGVLAGGHRRGTHDLILAPTIAGVATWLGLQHHLSSYLVVALLLGLAIRAATLGNNRPPILLANLIGSCAGAWWIIDHQLTVGMHLPWLVAGGVLVHCLGDLITVEGLPIPVLWLFGHRGRLTIPLFEVGGFVERWIVCPALNLTVLVMADRAFGWTTWIAGFVGHPLASPIFLFTH